MFGRMLDILGIRARATRNTVYGYVFIAPFVLGFLLWFIVPAGTSLWLVFQKWNLITPAKFVGLANLKILFSDKLLAQALNVTAQYALIAVPLQLVAALVLALLLNTKAPGISLFRTVYYLPTIVPGVASAVLWSFILNSEFGLLNAVLRAIGLPKVMWLQDPKWALPALILMSLWSVGGTMIIYLAGLQGIPGTYYEAAAIDGAGRLRKFLHITVPLLSPVILFNLVMGIIGSFQVFTAGYLITGGGPQNATLFYVLYLYRNAFLYLKMGYAAALAWVLFFIIVALTAIIFRGARSRVHYA